MNAKSLLLSTDDEEFGTMRNVEDISDKTLNSSLGKGKEGTSEEQTTGKVVVGKQYAEAMNIRSEENKMGECRTIETCVEETEVTGETTMNEDSDKNKTYYHYNSEEIRMEETCGKKLENSGEIVIEEIEHNAMNEIKNKETDKYESQDTREDKEPEYNEEDNIRLLRKKRHLVDKSAWTENVYKKNRESGKPYKGKRKEGGKWNYNIKRKNRDMGPRCKCPNNDTTVLKCNLISDEDRMKIFKRFWNMEWKEKRMYATSNGNVSNKET